MSKVSPLETIKKILFFDTFPFLCRLIATTLILLAFYSIGIPPEKDLNPSAIMLLVFSAFFFLLPIAKKMSIGRLLTYEKQVEKVKTEVSEFKTETREFLGIYSNMITAISNTVNQTVNVNLPGQAEAQQAKEDLDASIEKPEEASTIEKSVSTFIREADGDFNFALAKLRMEIEKSLREALRKRTITADPHAMKGTFLSARQLFRQFTIQYPKYENMRSSFDYILKVCNAAIHGQQVSERYAHEAIYMGTRMLKEIKSASE
ncbi:hypothetical protein [Desulfotalea psychrophila]|nr:hypothetical protein [Desulfotalea psychrophila]